MKIENLKADDTGRWVEYRDPNWPGHCEVGKIKRWTKQYVFVVYSCAGDWDRFMDYIASATNPDCLEFGSQGNED